MKEESHIVGYFQFDAEEFSVAIVLKDFWVEPPLPEVRGFLLQ